MKESLNELTSFNTLGLYILYSISKRLYLNQTLVIILAIAWAINLSLIIYLIYKIVKDKVAMEKSTKNCEPDVYLSYSETNLNVKGYNDCSIFNLLFVLL
jgi:hypothetical protein